MTINKRWLSSQVLLLVITGWVAGLAMIHNLWLAPAIRAQLARQEGSVAVRWIDQSLSGLAGERKELARACQAWVRSRQPSAVLASARPATTPDDELARGPEHTGGLVCDRRLEVVATFGWVNLTGDGRSVRPWEAGDPLAGGPLFPAAWGSEELNGLLSINGRVCVFAREPIGPADRPDGYAVLVRPIDWPMLQELSATTGVNVLVSESPASGAARDGLAENISHWSGGQGTLSSEIALKDSLGRSIGRLQASGSIVDIASSAESIRSAYVVQLLWLIGSALVTFVAVYLLFIRPLAILVRRLSDEELTRTPEKLSSGLFAETGILARKFADVMERIMVASETDPLTGLANRRHFRILLDHEFNMGLRHRGSLAAVMIDIDFFKQVNDRYGHLVGDEVLQMVARTIRQTCRKTDICGRYGGEEFAVVLPGTTMERATALAERIRAEIIRRSVPHGAGQIAVTVSAGVAATPALLCARPDELLDLADKALYRAKRAGRNRTVLASEADREEQADPAGQPRPRQLPAFATLAVGSAGDGPQLRISNR